ncbi:MAG TPA: GntR family transcriptional regulator [Terriglobales bacterium]|nr:GntR family transcriptional regulator [Terriglobales bacterium]
MIPFRVQFRPGSSYHEQVAYAATKAIISGQMRPGDSFPSVRALSRELKINPNTAHKVVAQLIAAGLLESRPGLGTVVAALPEATSGQKTQLLRENMERLAVNAIKLGINFEDVVAALSRHWKQLTEHGQRAGDGKA